MNFTGLSLEQAPPLSAPVRYFMTAPFFGMLAAVMIFFTDPALLMSRYSMESIVIVHLFTIGMFAMVMLGALQQMLPVLAGVSLPKAVGVSVISHTALVAGLCCMAYGLLQSEKLFIIIAAASLGIGFLSLLGAIALALRKVSFFTPTVKAMVTAVTVAFLIVMLGLHLLGAHASGSISAHQVTLSDIHSVWAIFGFGGILIVGVAFQVMPMFYVTPQFKPFFETYVVPFVVAALAGWLVLNFMAPESAWIPKAVIALFFLAFGAAVFKKMKERRRPTSDVTVWYWRLGASLLVAGVVLWVANVWLGSDFTTLYGVLIGGFLLSIITGMLYKIIPFLVWFHLNASGYMTIPTMREMISAKTAKVQFGLFAATLFLFAAAFWLPVLAKAGALTLLVSMVLLEANLILPLRTYRDVRKNPPEFVMTPSV